MRDIGIRSRRILLLSLLDPHPALGPGLWKELVVCGGDGVHSFLFPFTFTGWF